MTIASQTAVSGAVTPNSPAPALLPTSATCGLTLKSYPRCEITTSFPAIFKIPDLELVVSLYPATMMNAEPLPNADPPVGSTGIIQSASVETSHAAPASVATSIVRSPPAALNIGCSYSRSTLRPGWITEKVCPATRTVPVRS